LRRRSDREIASFHSLRTDEDAMGLTNEVRIIGGKWKRRKLRFPDRPMLRPTLDRVRVTVFNWLMAKLDGAVCLDLYAGSGALGFEAASRGARDVVLVERDPVVVRALEENRRRLDATNIEIVRADAMRWLQQTTRRFDVVFLDPPFASDELSRALETLRERALLAPDGVVYVELPATATLPIAGFTIAKESRAGETRYLLLDVAGV
jgi:16S rRNA (guanine966-N2)-methyltransferase